jgi:NCS1 family nucleobase:cation symporter-1
MMWTAILCVQAGGFLQNCIEAIWPSFRDFPNHLPADAGIDCKSHLAVDTCGHVDTKNSRRYSLLYVVLVPADYPFDHADSEVTAAVHSKSYNCASNVHCSFSMGRDVCLLSSLSGPSPDRHSVTRGGGELVTGKMVLKTDMGPAYSALTGLNVIIGLFSSMAVNMPVRTLSHCPHVHPLTWLGFWPLFA